MPVIKHYTGVCTVYVHGAADRELAEKIVVNAKAQRVSVCNSAENLLVDRSVAAELLPQLGRALKEAGVTLRADEEATAILAANELPSEPVTEEDWATEYLDYILAVKVVDGPAEAIAFINRYGSAHSDAIVTTDNTAAEAFLNGVDSATVYWNASTRFTDGYEFGLGAEIGISTDRLHARGPMGLRELTTYKYQIYGTGQIK